MEVPSGFTNGERMGTPKPCFTVEEENKLQKISRRFLLGFGSHTRYKPLRNSLCSRNPPFSILLSARGNCSTLLLPLYIIYHAIVRSYHSQKPPVTICRSESLLPNEALRTQARRRSATSLFPPSSSIIFFFCVKF